MARMAISNATKVAPLANGDLSRQLIRQTPNAVINEQRSRLTDLIKVGPRPPVKPLHPCVRQTLDTQSIMPLYCRLAGSNASVCNFDLMTSTGYMLPKRFSLLLQGGPAPRLT